MKFKEYLEFSQIQESIEFNEGIGSTLMGMLDAGISGTGTAGKQALRGTGNTARGLGGLVTHGLGTVFGDEESRQDAKGKLGSSLNRTLRGVSQLATLPYASVRRGWEAGRNPFSDLEPDDDSGWGELMGIRSRPEREEEEEIPEKIRPQKEKARTRPDINPPPVPDTFENLMKQLKSAIGNERKEILSAMKKYHPKQYEEFKQKVIKQRIINSKKVLGFEQNDMISSSILQKRYLELAKRYHPDKGGSTEMFKSIKSAFDYLSDELDKKSEIKKAI